MRTPPTPTASVARGRPPKFGRPSRAVTMTLPLDVIERLQTLDADLARAVVRLSGRPSLQRTPSTHADLSRYGRRAVITVNPTRSLRRVPGVELVPMPSGRALISVDPGVTPEALELRLRDALDGELPDADRAGIRQVIHVLSEARRKEGHQLQPRTILVLAQRRRRRS